MNPDKNEDANQIKLGRKCRDDLFIGFDLEMGYRYYCEIS
jgi:hypothetical protein